MNSKQLTKKKDIIGNHFKSLRIVPKLLLVQFLKMPNFGKNNYQLNSPKGG